MFCLKYAVSRHIIDACLENPHVIAFSLVSNTHQHIPGGAALRYAKKLVDDRDAFILDKGT